MKKNIISAKKLSREAKVQVLHMDDYFGDGDAHTSKPVKFGQFLDELAEDFEVEQLENDTLFAIMDGVTMDGGDKINLIEEWYAGCGDGNETFCLLTVVDGVVKVVGA